MIINLQKYKLRNFRETITFLIQTLYFSLFESDDGLKQFRDIEKLKELFKYKYPSLKLDMNNNTTCVSCKLCESVCPEKAIKIEVANLVNYPASLRVGEPPKKIILDFDSCIKCGRCSDVCLVDSIDMKNEYEVGKVNLIQVKKS